jgi:hypothetical protein
MVGTRGPYDSGGSATNLVLRMKQKTNGLHKLSSHWEGLFKIKAVTQPGSYRLCDKDERDVPNSWHIDLLRCFYA